MTTKNSENEEDVIYNYSSDNSHLEEENRVLRETLESLKMELARLKRAPLMVCEVRDIIDNQAVIRIPNGNSFLVEISQDCDDIQVGDTVLTEQKNLTVVRKIDSSKSFDVEKFVIMQKPEITWEDVGGLDKEIEEIKEVIELPLKRPHLFEKVGIKPPKGALLHGPPGTGKTLLAKAAANSTKATFIEIVGSELVQKFIGEGSKLVKEIFEMAKENAPSIIFIDEIDALAATRMEVGTSGEREVQRTFMQLLAEIDGFRNLGDVKVIGCTNRRDILDPAVTRPGRLDRMIEVSAPGEEGRKQIFDIHTKDMRVERKDIDTILKRMSGFSGAQIQAVATEAGYFSIRKNRTKVKTEDFLKAIEKVNEEDKNKEEGEYKHMFG